MIKDLRIEWLWVLSKNEIHEHVTNDEVCKGTILSQSSNILCKVV